MNFSNWQSMWKKEVVPLLDKFSQECWKSGPHFMSIMKVLHRPPGFRDKVVYINFFVMSARLTKFENCITYMVEPEISSLVFIFCFVCNPYPGCMAVMMTISEFSF